MSQGIGTFAAASAPFGPRMGADLLRVASIVESARAQGAGLVVLPETALGGYLRADGTPGKPLALDSPEIARLCEIAGDTVVCIGFTEIADGVGERPHSSAVCVWGDGILGHQRKVHLPPAEVGQFSPGERFSAFDTPVGRMGMLVCYDKIFPEAARTLALDGAEAIASLSAWAMDRYDPALRLNADRQTRHFNVLDEVRALENQVVWISSNLTGRIGPLRFVGQSKIVDPDGTVVAKTGSRAGLAIGEVDLAGARNASLAKIAHLADRMAGSYRLEPPLPVAPAPAGLV
ncbi:carbon-nitrogen hydrolase family protein [Thermoleophilia bacterium SCSIO 60948]|nr:carbon-nitrogen hydrolase family protein [Thermoleophilia bacterium SCSIO 60948]